MKTLRTLIISLAALGLFISFSAFTPADLGLPGNVSFSPKSSCGCTSQGLSLHSTFYTTKTYRNSKGRTVRKTYYFKVIKLRSGEYALAKLYSSDKKGGASKFYKNGESVSRGLTFQLETTTTSMGLSPGSDGRLQYQYQRGRVKPHIKYCSPWRFKFY